MSSDTVAFCESFISNYHRSGLLAGAALALLKDLGEFGSFSDFEDYCKRRWDIGKSHAYNLLAASSVFFDISGLSPLEFLQGSVSTIVEKSTPQLVEQLFPQNESQCRPLVPLAIDDRRRCWSRVLELHATGRRLSQSLVQQAVNELTAPPAGNISTDGTYTRLPADFIAQHPPRPYVQPHLAGGGYFGTFNAVIDTVSPALKDHTAVFVYIALLKSGINGICKVSHSDLAEKCSITEKSLLKKIGLLQSFGFFQVDNSGDKPVYKLHDLRWVLEGNGWVADGAPKTTKQSKTVDPRQAEKFKTLWATCFDKLSKRIHHQVINRVRVTEKRGSMLLRVKKPDYDVLNPLREYIRDTLGVDVSIEIS